MGFLSKGKLIVTHASLPGAESVRGQNQTTICGREATEFCDKMHDLSQGLLDYVGDWHTHATGNLQPSSKDVKALQLMGAGPWCRFGDPISLIYRLFPESVGIYRLNASRSKLEPCTWHFLSD